MAITRSIVIDGKKGKQNKEKSEGLEIKGSSSKAVKSSKTNTTFEKEIKFATENRPARVFNKKGKTLVIVESPAKSNTIEKFLGKDYVVKASMGHLRDLPASQLGIDVENGFTPRYRNLPLRKKLIDELIHEADKSKAVLLATDPDREGEAISWHLAHILNLQETDLCRVTFNEITKGAIEKAVASPRTIDMKMVNAQQARRILDRIVGYKLSPVLWKKICKGLSAGRVQSVATRFIVDREREIQAFQPEEYWTIEGQFKTAKGEEFPADLVHHKGKKVAIPNKKTAQGMYDELVNQNGLVEKIEKKKRSRKAAPPFTTSTLQQEGIRKLGFGAKRVMMVAQHLYEGKAIGSHGVVGLITYMRTDSTRIAKDMQELAKEFIISRYGKEYYPAKPNVYGSKESAQDAHEAIRPTSLELTPEVVKPYVTKDELKLYTLIWNRFLASQMSAQQTESVTVHIGVGDYGFKSVGSTVLFKGFTEVYSDEGKEKAAVPIPPLEEGAELANTSLAMDQHFTQPPPRYSEASLVKALEERGIGRPSTYAPTIDTITARNYVELQNKQFHPTELGMVVTDFLVNHFERFINSDFTAHMEESLDRIAGGNETYVEVLSEFYDVLSQELSLANDVEKVKFAGEPTGEACELCGHEMVHKFGRYGKFLACSNFPACKNTKPLTTTIGMTCPICKKGDVIERKSKRGRLFYGCSEYPSCHFTTWDKPIDTYCDTCGSVMVQKTYKNGTVKEYCSNESCATRPKKGSKKKTTKAAEGEQEA